MPESTCLHIQDRESGPIRVVDIPWISVRIGRAAYCEVRLTEDDLADEACRLYRRGRSWHIVPLAKKSTIRIGGRPVDAACPLPFDVPFRVGDHCLTLRQDRATEPDWDMYSGPVPASLDRPSFPRETKPRGFEYAGRLDPHAGSQPIADTALDLGPRAHGASKGLDSSNEHKKTVSLRDRWESRWRAAGAELNARRQSSAIPSQPQRPPFHTGFESVPLKEPRVPQAEPGARPRFEPPTRPISAPPGVAKIEPERAIPVPEPEAAQSTRQDLLGDRIAQDDWLEPLRDLARKADSVDCHADASSPHPAESAVSPPAGDESIRTATLLKVDPTTDGVGERGAELVDECSPMSEPEGLASIDGVGETHRHSHSETAAFDPPHTGSPSPAPTIAGLAAATALDPHDIAPETPGRQTDLTPNQPGDELRTPGSAHTRHATSRSRPRAKGRSAASPRDRDGEAPRSITVDRPEPEVAAKGTSLPSAQDILAIHRTVPRQQPTRSEERRQQPHAGPTLAREPAQWLLPVWLAGPAAAFALTLGLAGCTLSWWWALDSYSASVMIGRLMSVDRMAQRAPLPDSIAPPQGTWIRSTAQHLAHWGILVSQIDAVNDPSARDARGPLSRALHVSPLNPTARLALAQCDHADNGATISARGLGLSRDVVSLSWCARRLLTSGNKDDARKLYATALRLATLDDPSSAVVPRFSDDPAVPRYLLPGEEQVRDIVNELLSNKEWTFHEWKAALPSTPTASLAAARLLRERGSSEAETLLESVVDERQPLEGVNPHAALALAARAEAFALKSRAARSRGVSPRNRSDR